MDMFNQTLQNSKKYFPDLNIKYKDTDFLMKILSFILFFNKDFKTKYITTIGNTVYYPSEDFIKTRQLSSAIILLHELVHIYDSQKYSSILFSFLYLVPQILSILIIPLLFVNFYLFLPFFILFLLPLPAYFRMKFELRAYKVSLYVLKKILVKNNISYNLHADAFLIKKNFNGPAYYFMWIFSLNKEFDDAIQKIENNIRPFEDKIFDIIDSIVDS